MLERELGSCMGPIIDELIDRGLAE